jgi:hypothetical protein
VLAVDSQATSVVRPLVQFALKKTTQSNQDKTVKEVSASLQFAVNVMKNRKRTGWM